MLFKGLWLLFPNVHVFKDLDWAFIRDIFKYKETQGKKKAVLLIIHFEQLLTSGQSYSKCMSLSRSQCCGDSVSTKVDLIPFVEVIGSMLWEVMDAEAADLVNGTSTLTKGLQVKGNKHSFRSSVLPYGDVVFSPFALPSCEDTQTVPSVNTFARF